MSKVITVSRELGSGGREVGLRLAKKLGIPFYDKELIAMAAEDSNISEDLFHANDEVIAGQKRINYDDYATGSFLTCIRSPGLRPALRDPVEDHPAACRKRSLRDHWQMLRCDRRGRFPHLYLLQLQKACGADPGT